MIDIDVQLRELTKRYAVSEGRSWVWVCIIGVRDQRQRAAVRTVSLEASRLTQCATTQIDPHIDLLTALPRPLQYYIFCCSERVILFTMSSKLFPPSAPRKTRPKIEAIANGPARKRTWDLRVFSPPTTPSQATDHPTIHSAPL